MSKHDTEPVSHSIFSCIKLNYPKNQYVLIIRNCSLEQYEVHYNFGVKIIFHDEAHFFVDVTTNSKHWVEVGGHAGKEAKSTSSARKVMVNIS